MRPDKLRFGLFFFFGLSLFVHSASSQTLVSLGNHSISKGEFVKAFDKNNANVKRTDQSYRDYLELYIRYKLKVQEAYDQKLDTMPSLIAELQNFRNQIADSYLNDEVYVNKLVDEAFERSQKEIHLSQIYVALPIGASPADTLKAYNKIMKLYGDLKKGAKFEEQALANSDDPFAKTNKGDIGFITVFTLPYDLENLAYSTSPGNISMPFRGRNGYHIFKNLGERKAIGKMRAAQILLVFPLNPTEGDKTATKKRADSIHAALLKGSDFAELAKKFSGDNLSYQNGGEMPEFGVGKYNEAFEKAAFALTKDGEISDPVLTDFGYHIIKRLARKPIPAEKSKASTEILKQQVTADARIEIARKAMTAKIFRLTGFSEKHFDERKLWIYTDSSLQNKPVPDFPDLDAGTALFSFAKKTMTVRDWISYRNSIRNVSAMTRNKTNRELLERFEQTAATEYYRAHLEDYNEEFARQLNEFKDGNMLFEIMQKKVWDKASSDSAGLRNYYESHKDKYWWEPSADAVLFTCTSEKSAEDVKKLMAGNKNGWRKINDQLNGLVQTDSGRFELSQLPAAEQNRLQEGQFSSMTKNQTDNSIVTAYIVHLYSSRLPRNYDDARGMVVNDYQILLEDRWITELKTRFPVRIDETVFKTLPK